jgi:hypothetical protein
MRTVGRSLPDPPPRPLAAVFPSASFRGNFFLILFIFYLVGGYCYLALGSYTMVGAMGQGAAGGLDLTGRPRGADFLGFGAASALARQGEAAAVYSPARIYEMGQAMAGEHLHPMAWNYPPGFLLLLLPLAYLPYPAALAVWLAATLGGYLAAVRRIAPHPLTPILFLAFPGAVANFLYCQNGFLSAGLLAGGLLLLGRRPLAGGGLLGLLSYKPQLAVFLPLALAAGRRWRALGGAAASAGALALTSLAILGVEPWKAFFENLHLAAGLMDQPVNWPKMPTVFAAARLAGANYPVAMGVQAVAALGAAAAVIRVWSRPAPLALRAAALITGTFLAVPYAFEYDLAVLGPVFAWLGWQEMSSRRQTGLEFISLAWGALYLAAFPPFHLGFQINPLILLALLLFVLRRSAQG